MQWPHRELNPQTSCLWHCSKFEGSVDELIYEDLRRLTIYLCLSRSKSALSFIISARFPLPFTLLEARCIQVFSCAINLMHGCQRALPFSILLSTVPMNFMHIYWGTVGTRIIMFRSSGQYTSGSAQNQNYYVTVLTKSCNVYKWARSRKVTTHI